MYSYVIEELARAIAQEREEEIRKMRPQMEKRRENRLILRSLLARKLVQAGMHLDRTAGESAPQAPASSCC